MAADRYQVIFSGRVQPGKDPVAVRQRVGQMFHLEGVQLERLFSGSPIVIKKDIDLDKASRLREAFKAAGALVELKKMELQPASTTAPAASPSVPRHPEPPSGWEQPVGPQGMELAPPRTGSLIDFAPKEEPIAIPNISGIALAEPGTQVAPPGEEPPAPVTDLSGIELAELGVQVADEQEPPPPPPVGTSELELSPARTGSLEGYAQEEQAVRIPSIDHLGLAKPDDGV